MVIVTLAMTSVHKEAIMTLGDGGRVTLKFGGNGGCVDGGIGSI